MDQSAQEPTQITIGELVTKFNEVQAQLERANMLIARVVNQAYVELDDETNEPVNDNEAIIDDELYTELAEYCDGCGIETDYTEGAESYAKSLS